MKDVIITITATQATQDESDMDTLAEFSTVGAYSHADGCGTISYFESELTGMEGTRTCVTIQPHEVVVDRDGTVKSRMVFREGSKDSFLYSTPFGQATLGVDTRRIRGSMDERGGQIEIDYVVDMEHAVVTRNRFQITVRQRGEQHG